MFPMYSIHAFKLSPLNAWGPTPESTSRTYWNCSRCCLTGSHQYQRSGLHYSTSPSFEQRSMSLICSHCSSYNSQCLLIQVVCSLHDLSHFSGLSANSPRTYFIDSASSGVCLTKPLPAFDRFCSNSSPLRP